MPTVVEEIPEAIRPEVDAALAWLNRERGSSFRVTGIVDLDELLARREGAANEEPLDLGLVLCEGDLCLREQLRVRASGAGFEVSLADDAARRDDPPPLLDPAPGARKGWITEQLAQHAFVVLIFYRGFW